MPKRVRVTTNDGTSFSTPSIVLSGASAGEDVVLAAEQVASIAVVDWAEGQGPTE